MKDSILRIQKELNSLRVKRVISKSNDDNFPLEIKLIDELEIGRINIAEDLKNKFNNIKLILLEDSSSFLNNPIYRGMVNEKLMDLEVYCELEIGYLKKSCNQTDLNNFHEYLKVLRIHTGKLLNFLKHYNGEIKYEETKKPKKHNAIKWIGTQIEFIELVKALIENGTINGKQKDIIHELSLVLNIKINNPDKTISDLKKRNYENETKFIDSLKSSLKDYLRK